MMLDRNLFFALCEKYNVELSDSAEKPMIKDRNGVHPVTNEDISRVFAPCQISFGYSGKKLNANIITTTYYPQEDFAIAC